VPKNRFWYRTSRHWPKTLTCQFTWLLIKLAGEAKTKTGNNPTTVYG